MPLFDATDARRQILETAINALTLRKNIDTYRDDQREKERLQKNLKAIMLKRTRLLTQLHKVLPNIHAPHKLEKKFKVHEDSDVLPVKSDARKALATTQPQKSTKKYTKLDKEIEQLKSMLAKI
ncbi:hypothetical protein CL622_01045 [archaeon]|nr:hypothetical protein [archaeon]